MKRDMDLVREILLQLENWNEEPLGPAEIAIDGRTKAEISYHIEILDEAGLLEGKDWSSHDGHDWRAVRLTWWGHEFLDAARSETIWNEAKSRLTAIGSFTFDIAKDLLTDLIKKQVGLE